MFDVRDFLKQSARDLAGDLLHPLFRNQSATGLVASLSVNIQVPNDQIWIVTNLHTRLASAADNINSVVIKIVDSGGNNMANLWNEGNLAIPVQSQVALRFSDLILPPNAILNCLAGFTGFVGQNANTFSVVGVSIPRGNFDSL